MRGVVSRKSTFETSTGPLNPQGPEATPPRLLIIDSFLKAIAAMG